MSVSLENSYDIWYDGTDNVSRFDLFIDSSADLSGLTHFDSVKLAQGSKATDISTGDIYRMTSAGSWILQPQSIFQNLYTKAEIDAMITDIDSDISDLFAGQYLHDSTQVNLSDVTWTRSGGGLYYSSTVQIPDSPISKIYHATLSGFANIRSTDVIIPAVRRSGGWGGFLLYANTGTFLSGAWVTVSVSGVQ